jgi:hypothetical protein
LPRRRARRYSRRWPPARRGPRSDRRPIPARPVRGGDGRDARPAARHGQVADVPGARPLRVVLVQLEGSARDG